MDGDGSTSAILIPIILILLFIVLSAFFSASETAATASNRLRMKTMADSGNKRAKSALKLMDRLDKTMTSSLVGNTLVNMAMGSIATLLAARLGMHEAVMTVVITVVVILFGEVFPKTLAKSNPEQFLITIVPLLRFVIAVLTPVSIVFYGISRLTNRIFRKNDQPAVTEEDVYDLIETMEEEGNYDADEANLLYSAYEFGKFTVKDIMTDKNDIVALDVHTPTAQLIEQVKDTSYSRLPVIDGNLNRTIGVVRVRVLLEQYLKDGKVNLRRLMTPPLYVRDITNVDVVLALMKKRKNHCALVKNSSGRIIGLVTMEDMLEELVGEIWDENENAEEEFRTEGENAFMLSTDLSVVSAFELMHFDNYDRDEVGHYTLLNWAQKILERPLQDGDAFSYNNLSFTAVAQENELMLKAEILPFDPLDGEEEPQ